MQLGTHQLASKHKVSECLCLSSVDSDELITEVRTNEMGALGTMLLPSTWTQMMPQAIKCGMN